MKYGLRRSFTTRIFMTVLLVALVPMVLSFGVMLPLLMERSESARAHQARAQLARAEEALERTLSAFDRLSMEMTGNDRIISALAQGQAEEREIYEILFAAAAPMYDYGHFYLCDAGGQCLYAVNGGARLPALQPDWGVLQRAGQGGGMALEASDEGKLLLARAAGNAGYGVIVMDQGHFDTLFDGCCDPANHLLLTDAQWRLVYAAQTAQGEATAAALRQRLWEGKPLAGAEKEAHFYTAPVGETGLTLILRQPATFTSGVMATLFTVSGTMGCLCLFLCLWGAWVLSRHLAKPVRELSAAMGEAERGNLTLRLDTGREDELGRLADSFNRMTAEYQDNLRRSVQRQKELNDVRLRMMQAQLNPHFLYNTLDSMKWMGVTHHVPQVAALATDLASLLRASISGNEFVTLEQELELVERYIDIQSIRFEDRFTCEIAVGEEYQGCLVPKLVLQPLVENAIIHGVGDREDGYIKIWAEAEGQTLALWISDNGCGMAPDMVEAINRGDAREAGGRLGIYNVNSIIKLHFGQAYGITAQSAPGEGCRMSVRLPMQKKEA